MKTAVVFYSKTGHTRLVAESLADSLNATIIELRTKSGKYSNLLSAYVRGGFDALIKAQPELEPSCALAHFDRFIIGTPVWAGTICPVVRTFLSQQHHSGKPVAIFSTCSSGETNTLFEMSQLVAPSNALAAKIFTFKPNFDESEIMNDISQWTNILKLFFTIPARSTI
jgi:menaquinone-dependent protoporphyrinogen IX oxidase